MAKYVLIKARDGRIGPGSFTESFSYHNYEDALEDMVADIEGEGGGEYSEDFGNGYSNSGFVYEIFPA